jgi:hypothetical protein
VPTPNPIQVENAKAGSSSWQLTNPATNHEIEGYASATSVNAGDQINFYVNTTSSFFTIDVYRIGWYAGLGARELAGPFTVAGAAQPTPTPDPTTGRVECNWTKSYTLATSSTWTTGYYLAKLTATSSGKQSYIIFVLRNDSSTSAYLMQSSVTTYQAYNNWGGKSLYSFNSTNSIPAVKVSFDRPYAMGGQSGAAPGVGAGDFIANFAPSYETYPAGWEINMMRFLEREGYDVSYCTSIDVDLNGATLLPKHDGFLSVGHDEYWSWNQRTNVEAARDAGVSLGFFGADPCYWQIRFEADSSGTPSRTEVSYKENADTQDPYALDHDPTNDYLITGLWRENSVDPPEDAFIGVMYVTDPVNGNLTIEDSSNWVCANTGLTDGVSLSGLLGYEMDCMFFDAPEGTARVGHSSYTSIPMPTRRPIEGPMGGLPGTASNTLYSDMTVYTADSGATVFATGSMQWNFGLDDYNYPNLRPSFVNPAAQQITRNVLASFVGARPTVSPPTATVTFSDNFDDNVMDPNKWQLGAIAPTLIGGPNAWDTKVTVAEQNQQMQVSPVTRTGSHYNGYVSVPSIDLTNASAAVQVVDVANGNADTYLAVDIDSQNNYKIQQEGGLLYFAEVSAGVVNQVSIPYDPIAHQFWRIRHIQSTDSVVFETSRDGITWTLRNSLPRDLAVNAMKMEIGAGTNQSVTGAGTASFDNFEVDARPSPPPTPTPSATPIPTPTPSPTPSPTPETVSTPTKPTGTTSTYTNHSYTYTTGGAVDNYGYSVQYYFDWGDGTSSGWLPVGTVSATKTWTAAASRSVKAQARSSVHTSIVSAYSTVLTVTVTAESVTAPTKPSGPTSGTTNTSYTYSTSGSVDNAGDSVQYLFDWADGSTSGWLAVGTKSASHKWTTTGTKTVKAQARCSIHTSVVSAYSTGLSVTINPPETISTPSKPSGPTTGKANGTYTFSTSGSVSNLGHSVQYQFDWGDGSKSAWLAVGTKSASHNWGNSGTYTVKAQARCSIDTSVLSANSTGATIALSP